MSTFKRFTCFLLAFLMVFSMVPSAALAAEATEEAPVLVLPEESSLPTETEALPSEEATEAAPAATETQAPAVTEETAATEAPAETEATEATEAPTLPEETQEATLPAEEDIPLPTIPEETQSPEGELSTAWRPDLEMSQSVDLSDTLQTEAAYLPFGDQRALLIQDNIPWYRDVDANQEVLSRLVPYDCTTTSGFQSVDLTKYTIVIFANDQATGTYTAYERISEKMTQFVNKGGVVVFGAADGGWSNGTLNYGLPGGVTKVEATEYYNTIADANHPIVTGQLTGSSPLTNSDLVNGYCSHIYFNSATFPKGTNVILRNQSGNATLIEYPLGKGRIIASGLTWEHAYQMHGKNIDGSVVCGDFAIKAMDDLFAYALYASTVNSGNITQLGDDSVAYNEHLVIVADADTFQPIANASVSMGVKKIKTDAAGHARFTKISTGSKQVKVSADGYRTSTVSYTISGGDKRFFFLTTTDDSSAYLEGASVEVTSYKKDGSVDTVKTYDARQETVTIKKGNTYKITLTGNFGAGGTGYYAMNCGTAYTYSNSGVFTVDKDGKFSNSKGSPVSFGAGQLEVRVVDAKGKRSAAEKLKIFVPQRSEGSLWGNDNDSKFSLGKTFGFTLPDSAGILANMDLNFGFDLLPVTYSVTDDSIKIAIGVSKSQVKTYSDLIRAQKGEGQDAKNALDYIWQDYLKQFDDAKKTKNLKTMMKNFGAKKGSFKSVKGFDTDCEIMGYITAKYNNETGEMTQVSGEVCISGSGSASSTTQFVIGPVPVYFKISGGIKLENTAKVTNLRVDAGEIIVEDTLVFTPDFTLGGGVGISGALSAGGYGNASLPITLVAYDASQNVYTNVALSGEMGLEASVLFVFTAKKTLAKGTWQIARYYWNNGHLELFSQGINDNGVDLLDLNSYQLMDRSYLRHNNGWYTENLSTQALVDGMTVLESGIMPSTSVQTVALNDGRYLAVFQDDDPEQNAVNRSALMYSIFDNGIWSAPQKVWDNGAADMTASIQTGNAGTYVVWQKAGRALTESDDVYSAADAMEIACARFDSDSGTFVDQKYLTQNSTLDMVPAVAVDNSTAYALWVSNASGGLLGGGTNVVKGTNLSTGSEFTLYSGSHYITGITARANGGLKAALTLDADADLNTLDDTDIYYWNGSSLSNITADEVSQVSAQFGPDGNLYWFQQSENAVYSYSGGKRTLYAQHASIGSNFKVVSNGSKTGITWLDVDENGDECMSALVRSGGSWSEPVSIVSSSSKLQTFSPWLDSDGSWRVVATALTESGTPVLLYNGVTPYITTTVSNLHMVERSVTDTTYKLMMDFANNSETPISALNVEFRDENGQLVHKTKSACSLKGGQSGNMVIDVNIPVQIEPATYTVCVYPEGERDLGDNTGLIELGFTELELDVSHYFVGENIVFTATVKNNSEIPSDAVLTIREDNPEDGIVLDIQSMENVGSDAPVSHNVLVTPGTMNFNGKPEKVLYFDLEAAHLEDYVDNNHYSYTVQNPKYVDPDAVDSVSGIQINEPDLIQMYLDSSAEHLLAVELLGTGNLDAWPVSYASSDPGVVEVDVNGRLTAKNVGTAQITASVDGTELTASVSVKVSLMEGKKLALGLFQTDAFVTPDCEEGNHYRLDVFTDRSGSALPNQLFDLSVSDPGIASVDSQGNVACLKAGRVTITAVLKANPKLKASLKLTVAPRKAATLTLSYSTSANGSIYSGTEYNTSTAVFKKNATPLYFRASCYAADGTLLPGAKVTYTSTNTKVATVNKNGVLTAKGTQGTTIIKAVSGNASAEFLVYVYDSYAPILLSGSSIKVNSLSETGTAVEVQPVARSSISSYSNRLYTAVRNKNGTYTYSTSYNYYVSSTASYPNGVRQFHITTAGNSFKEGAKQYYLRLTVDGTYYYLPIKVSASQVYPKVTVAAAGYNAFFSDHSGLVTASSGDGAVESVQLVSKPNKKKLSSPFYLTSGTTSATYRSSSSLTSHLASGGKLNSCNTSYEVRVYVDGYRLPVVKNITLPVKYSEPVIKLGTKSLTVAPDTLTTNVPVRYVSTQAAGEQVFTSNPLYSGSSNSSFSAQWNSANPGYLSFVVYGGSGKATQRLSFRQDNWIKAISVPISLKSAVVKVAPIEKNISLDAARLGTPAVVHFNYRLSDETKIQQLRSGKEVSDLSVLVRDGALTIALNQRIGGKYTLKVTPVLENGVQCAPVSIPVTVSKATALTTKITGKLDANNMALRATATLKLKNNSLGMTKVSLRDAYSSPFEITDTVFADNGSTVTVVLKLKEGMWIPGGKQPVNFSVQLGDSRTVYAASSIQVTGKAITLKPTVVYTSLSARSQTLSATVTLQGREFCSVSSVEVPENPYYRAECSGATVTLTPILRSKLKVGTMTLPMIVTVQQGDQVVTMKSSIKIILSK